jgi:hypothetical protein
MPSFAFIIGGFESMNRYWPDVVMQLSSIDVPILPRGCDCLPTTGMSSSTHHAEATVVGEAAAVDDEQ